MLVNVLLGVNLQNQVVQLGERGVLSALAGHVDDTLLESNDLTSGNNCHTAKYVGSSFTNYVYLGHHAREHSAVAGNLNTRLDHVLNGHDADAVSRLSDEKLDVLDIFIFLQKVNDIFLIYIKSIALDF